VRLLGGFWLVALALLGLTSRALAARPEPLFSGEIEFTNLAINKGQGRDTGTVNMDTTVEYKNRFKKVVMSKCPECEAQRIRDDKYGIPIWRIVFPDGWWFEITTDPATIEIKTKPSTVRQLRALVSRIQTYIFDSAHAIGTIGRYEENSAAQIHLGVRSAFGEDTMRFRNFLIDDANHPSIFSGVLFQDFYNAPPLTAQGPGTLRRLDKVLAPEAIAGRSIEDVAKDVREKVHDLVRDRSWGEPQKSESVSLVRVDPKRYDPNAWTAELRALPAHDYAESFVRVVELFDGRIAYLDEKFGSNPIRLAPSQPTKANRQEKVDEFFSYVVESGRRWRDYVPLVNFRYRHVPPSIELAERLLGGWSSQRFVQHVFDLIDLRVYDRADIVRSVEVLEKTHPRAGEMVRAKLAKAEAPIKAFPSPYNQPVAGYEYEFLSAAKAAGEHWLRETARLQPGPDQVEEKLTKPTREVLVRALGPGRSRGNDAPEDVAEPVAAAPEPRAQVRSEPVQVRPEPIRVPRPVEGAPEPLARPPRPVERTQTVADLRSRRSGGKPAGGALPGIERLAQMERTISPAVPPSQPAPRVTFSQPPPVPSTPPAPRVIVLSQPPPRPPSVFARIRGWFGGAKPKPARPRI
jgi:hypothetical protein